jgi:hypothetical protein
MGAEAITTGGGPVHGPENGVVPSVTLKLPAGLIDTEVLVAPEANDVKAPVEPASENGCVAPIGKGLGSVTDPAKVTF